MLDTQTTNSLPLVSIVTVSFNCGGFLRKCLSSLMQQTYPNIEIILVDNGSTENIAAMKNEFPAIKYIRLEKNSGFAAGNNAGICEAKGKYVALINNDAQADPEWLNRLVSVAELDKNTGAVASLILDGNNPEILDSCGVVIALDGMSHQAMHGIKSSIPLTRQKVLAFSGCACLLRMQALKQTGLFDERFFAYCEDTDLSFRLLRAGWDIITEPEAKVLHFYSKTAGAFSLQKIFWIERNHYWVAIKNFPITILLFLPIISLWRYIFQLYAVLKGYGKLNLFIANGSLMGIIKTLLSANLAVITGIIPAIRSRLSFQTEMIRTSSEMRQLILSMHVSIKEIITGTS
ncbi:MAG: glycosyltransferase family 2 protein [Kiritimatiellae bacterium]|nr:glycosyltransferase family 2 protein [Kiritimatiellia bacterium]MDD5522838.1 glycosyltransferase family 2 protein [Kiritimatiellia bacterium]